MTSAIGFSHDCLRKTKFIISKEIDVGEGYRLQKLTYFDIFHYFLNTVFIFAANYEKWWSIIHAPATIMARLRFKTFRLAFTVSPDLELVAMG